jgi:hypothetical protein
MSSEQPLNSVGRFRKQSEKLVLEQYAHCEIPAGCGGVILRWRNPHAALPLIVHLYTPVPATCFIDGNELRTAGIDLAPGPHLAAISIERVDLSVGFLMFAAVNDSRAPQKSVPDGLTESPLKVLSAEDSTWKFTLDDPETDDWKSLSFDEQGWPTLTRFQTPVLDWGEFGAYPCRCCDDLGSACLGIAAPSQSMWAKLVGRRAEGSTIPPIGNAWVRKAFEVPAPVSQNPSK